jgi:hypothetical protein
VSGRKSIAVIRTYRPELNDCTRALKMLLKPSFNSQTSKGGPHALTSNSIKECTTRQDQKGMQDADLHGD